MLLLVDPRAFCSEFVRLLLNIVVHASTVADVALLPFLLLSLVYVGAVEVQHALGVLGGALRMTPDAGDVLVFMLICDRSRSR
jgi:hypothetical protein